MTWDDLVDRQQGIRNLSGAHLEAIRATRVAVIGAGGNGSVLDVLLRTGYERFVILDFDEMEASNLNRLPLPPDGVGRPKVEVWRDYLQALNPAVEVRAHRRRLGYEDVDWLRAELSDCDIVVNCISTADVDGVLTVARACRLARKPMIGGPGTANCWCVTTIVHDDAVSLESALGLGPEDPWPPTPERLRALGPAFARLADFPGREERLQPGVGARVRSGEIAPRSAKIFVMMVNAALAWEVVKNTARLHELPLEGTEIVRFPRMQFFDPFRGAGFLYDIVTGAIGVPDWRTGAVEWHEHG